MRRTSKVPTASPGLATYRSADDAVQSLRQENAALKKERNDLSDKLQRVQVQFQRLVADVRQQHGVTHSPSTTTVTSDPAPATTLPFLRRTSSPSARGSGLTSPLSKSDTPARELNSTRQALAQAQEEIQQLRQSLAAVQQQLRLQSHVSALAGAPATQASQHGPNGLSDAEQHRYQGEVASLRQQLSMAERRLSEMAQAALTSTPPPLHDASAASPHQHQQQPHLNHSALVKAAQEEIEAKYKSIIQQLTRDNQELTVRVKLMEQDKAFDVEESVAVDPATITQLQSEVREKAHMLTLFQSRMESSQGQMEMLKGECARLVEELKHCHEAAGEQKKEIFQLAHDKSNLERRIGQLQEVELALQRKSEEVINLEHELLKSVGALQSCNRETEQAVRGEFVSKVRELQEMRDQADASRRRAEKELLETRQALEATKRRCESFEEDVVLYKTELAKAEKKNQTLAAQSTLFSHSAQELTEAEVHRAIAVAAIQRRAAAEKDMGLVSDLEDAQRARAARTETQSKGGDADRAVSSPTEHDSEANKALDLYEALQWDDSWEHGKLREALAAAALDMELAESRCQQMHNNVESARAQLAGMVRERDTLLEENLELRRRLTHVQTVFAKQQLETYRKSDAAHRHGPQSGLIRFCIRDLQCEDGMAAALRMNSLQEPTTVFFSLDGLDSYETMLSPALHSLTEPIDVLFEYADLDKDEVTVGLIQRTRFTFQLHHVGDDGTGSAVVAMAELPGTALFAARESQVEEVLRLVDGSGRTLGRLTVECACAQLMLPVLLQAPLGGSDGRAMPFLSADEVTSAVVALRAVRFLRVQVFKANGVFAASDTAPHRLYVFYTGHTPAGAVNCVRDTVVRPTQGNTHTGEITFDDEPADHRVVPDRDLIAFLAHGSIVFVVFDENSSDVQTNMGTVTVSLRPLLASPQAFIHTTEALHPQGQLVVGVSWVSGP